jgi:hypothetical protein|tara:strand:+ start:1245 stop:1448 length:204 start_codon:yes stop_codon:yes gene_type:complete
MFFPSAGLARTTDSAFKVQQAQELKKLLKRSQPYGKGTQRDIDRLVQILGPFGEGLYKLALERAPRE